MGRVAIVYWVLALAFIAAMPFAPYHGSWLLKAAPILLLAWFQWKRARTRADHLLFAGLIFSALGDILLNVSPQLFIGGLVSFLLAYALYASAFYGQRKFTPFRIGIAAGEYWYSIALLFLLFPTLGPLAYPVIAYVTVVTTMAALGALRGDPHPYVGLGALLLMSSDSILAINRFAQPIPFHEFPEMTTYYLGQFLVMYGCAGASSLDTPAR